MYASVVHRNAIDRRTVANPRTDDARTRVDTTDTNRDLRGSPTDW